MAPTAGATARELPVREGAVSARPSLRLFEPAPRHRSARPRFGRSTLWLSAGLVAGSLFSVVIADGMVAQRQIVLSQTEARLSAATAVQKSLQLSVAEMTAPPVVVKQAESHGMVAPSQVVDLPQVSLDVPLPAPHLVASSPPAPGGTGGVPAAASLAGR